MRKKKLNLYPHQKRIIDIAKDKYLLPHSCGTGKTITSLEIMKKKNVESVLVICPKSIVKNWEEEIKNYQGSFKIITKEYLRTHWQELKKYDGMIWDEIHFASNLTSGIHKATMSYIKKWNIQYVIGATATPFSSTPNNILALSRILGRSWSYMKFRTHFFYPVKMGSRLIWLAKPNMEKEIARLVNSLGETVKMSDCVEVPSQIFQQEYFDLTAEQKKAIKEIKMTEAMPIVQWTKIHQVCGGSLKGDGYVYVKDRLFKCEKLQRVKDLCSQHPLIAIVCRYNAEIEMLSRELDTNYIINGKTQDRHSMVNEVNKKDRAIVLINGVCSEGFELPKIPIMIFYSYDFSLKNYIQMRGRVNRIDKLKKNVYISLITKNTIDNDVYQNVVIKKQDYQIAIFNK